MHISRRAAAAEAAVLTGLAARAGRRVAVGGGPGRSKGRGRSACTPHVYTAGTPDNAFIDPGDGHVHIIRDESGAVAKTVAVQFVPAGTTTRRQDAPAPGNCPF